MQISSIESPIARSASSLEIEISIATNPSNPVSYNPCQSECQRSILQRSILSLLIFQSNRQSTTFSLLLHQKMLQSFTLLQLYLVHTSMNLIE